MQRGMCLYMCVRAYGCALSHLLPSSLSSYQISCQTNTDKPSIFDTITGEYSSFDYRYLLNIFFIPGTVFGPADKAEK